MVRLALLLLLLFAAPACSSDAPDAKALAVLPNFAVQTPTLSTSGKLQAGDVAVVVKAGIRHVINLRPDSETPEFNEAAAVGDAGLQYHSLPIRGAQDLTVENVARFDRLITEVGDQATLIHCSSSNRVGAGEVTTGPARYSMVGAYFILDACSVTAIGCRPRALLKSPRHRLRPMAASFPR